ncbi:Osmosensitive K channel His kinase sensor [Ammonifex degensii KC4]|uniref:Osmosensitive K channel His kinase sensor n=1 Tax=Ammonifex degensii (strain DSM 10501 / KC4) TaxID=429009 RepID=C9R8E9_AMMDK|nr:universal stress protein [Ammonifex degensii]ACX52578.1 Osmosensitive K channel His kinase sensor [Ammonifex degensii KC4]
MGVNGGRLKLLVGIISWPGNTVALLQEGQELLSQGRDVVIGILKYSDPEIEALSRTLRSIPPLGERLNLPEILAQRPEVVLVDDAGALYPEDSPYQARWQEVEEILAAGIDVVATVHALELEGFKEFLPFPLTSPLSLSEGIIPASFLDRASEVELVDVTPEELSRQGISLPPGFDPRSRLGPYLAAANFAAFRRAVLKRLADEVDEQLFRPGVETRAKAARERILLAVSTQRNLERLLRRSLLLAERLQASLMVVHLRVPGRHQEPFPWDYVERMLASVGGTWMEEEVGDESEVPARLSEIIAANHITRLVVGHSARSRWEELVKGSVLNELLRRNRHINVLVVAPASETKEGEAEAAPGGAVPDLRLPLKGKLKIYLGPIAGVGKTYRMLRDAHELKEKGVDVVVGYVETHGRAETEAQIGDLEVLPRKQVVYRGKTFTELDLEGVLRRRPQVVLIDELAHTNVPGVKNAKRYQDVLEILAAGIDVYTTLNVQHLESLNDVIEEITGVKVRETLPDWVLALADEIILVDLASSLLLKRLEQGKIYPLPKVEQALRHFFRPENIIALRELALRQLAHYLGEKQARLAPERKERILVAVNLKPYAERLVRRGLRLAVAQHAELMVVHCDVTGGKLSPEATSIRNYLKRLCDSIGISYYEQKVLSDRDVALVLANLCRAKGITQMVLGHSQRSRWQEFWKGSVISQLLRFLRTVDLHLVPVNSGSWAAEVAV